jgi:hypothetical protein
MNLSTHIIMQHANAPVTLIQGVYIAISYGLIPLAATDELMKPYMPGSSVLAK